ncbi:hypothetical protein [Nocardioides sp. LHG3406-4]|uniref:hypothetical protein n=1 Tax=Nocardioides sp. LHG3406-4 TaxID=2804575 RepID=UPI003CF6D6AB
MSHPLDGFLANAPAPFLVLVDDASPEAADLLPASYDGEAMAVSRLTEKVRIGQRSVLLVTADRASLRRVASALPRLGQVRVVGVWTWASTAPLVLRPRGEWPTMTSLNARPLEGRGHLTVARFDDPVGAQPVLLELARQAAGPVDAAHGGVVVAYAGRPPAPGLDVRALHLETPADAEDPERDVPPDVVAAGRMPIMSTPMPHHVIGRASAVVPPEHLDPVDEQVFNPVGFRKHWDTPVVPLASLGLGPGGLTERALTSARAHQGVRVDLAADPVDQVLALAMAGVPLVASGSAPGLAPRLSAALATPVDLDDALAREEHSLRVRRATFDHHSTLAWRSGLAARAGVRHAGLPPVSILLATMRPQQLDFALRQVARQEDATVELVLATHGFAADEAKVEAALGSTPYVLLDFGQDEFFGDVLTAAARAASGEVLLKIDDDDWYSPHVVHDLLMARRYTGADVVGMPSEFVYLQQSDVTVRRNHPSEIFNRFVAGGTIMIDRGMLRALGDFRRVRRFVDTQLLAGVEAAGGRIYRTHGLGYVLRRTGSGHTWAMDDEQFRRAEIIEAEWPGFHPSAELQVEG